MTSTSATTPTAYTDLIPEHQLTDSVAELVESADAVAPDGRKGRILIGVDGSEQSMKALRQGIALANALNSSVRAVATWHQPTGYAALGASDFSPESDAVAILGDAERQVFASETPGWFTTATLEGSAAHVLVELSRGAEMLVVGSRGHAGLAGVFMGSVSGVCAEHAHCPVLVVH